uniref:Uncharacterized protein n=1 Tax=Anopheles melas TaxID=34690 RepID=A0A182THM9_9DIPT
MLDPPTGRFSTVEALPHRYRTPVAFFIASTPASAIVCCICQLRGSNGRSPRYSSEQNRALPIVHATLKLRLQSTPTQLRRWRGPSGRRVLRHILFYTQEKKAPRGNDNHKATVF